MPDARSTGRKNGQTRTNLLVYAKDGHRYLVVASTGGHPKAPAWTLNLRSEPQVKAQIGRTRFQAMGTEIGAHDPDYARLWRLVNDQNGNRTTHTRRRPAAVEHSAATSRSPRAIGRLGVR